MPLAAAPVLRRAVCALALCAVFLAMPAYAQPGPQPPGPQAEAPQALLVRAYFHLSAEGGGGPEAALADLDAYEAALKGLGGEAGGPAGRGLAPALLLRSAALRALGRHAEAVAAVDRMLLLPGPPDLEGGVSRAEAFVERGRSLAHLGRQARALEDYGQALAQEPGNVPALMARGDLYFVLGQAAEAEADYGRALELEPGNALAWANRGAARGEQGRHAEAEADFARAIRLDPGMVAAWTGRGVARSQTGDMAGMCADYREACARGDCARLGQARAVGYCQDSGGAR